MRSFVTSACPYVCFDEVKRSMDFFFLLPTPLKKDSDAGMAGKRAAFSGLPSRAELTELQA
jgi:hypothetical protein